MHIAYLSSSPLYQAPANAVHVMRMCASMAATGHRVTLFARKGGPGDSEFLCREYGGAPQFDIKFFEIPRIRGLGVLLYGVVQGVRSALLESVDLIYGRCIPSAVVALALGKGAVVEFHEVPKSRWLRMAYRYVLRHKRLLRAVSISGGLLADLRSTFPKEAEKLQWIVAHDGADPVEDVVPFKFKQRGVVNVGYAGGLRSGNGIQLILELAEELPDYRFHIAGGPDSLVNEWVSTRTNRAANVDWYGRIAPAQVPAFLMSCDILIAPYVDGPKTSGGSDTSRWMSPLKVFEYLATGRAIVVSDMPVLREVLSNETACLARAGDVKAWSSVLLELQNKSLRDRIGAQGQRHFREHFTWSARAAKVLDGLDFVDSTRDGAPSR